MKTNWNIDLKIHLKTNPLFDAHPTLVKTSIGFASH
jgi:hypothetical protein